MNIVTLDVKSYRQFLIKVSERFSISVKKVGLLLEANDLTLTAIPRKVHGTIRNVLYINREETEKALRIIESNLEELRSTKRASSKKDDKVIAQRAEVDPIDSERCRVEPEVEPETNVLVQPEIKMEVKSEEKITDSNDYFNRFVTEVAERLGKCYGSMCYDPTL